MLINITMKREFDDLSLYVRNWSVINGKYWIDWIYLEDLLRYIVYKLLRLMG